MSDLGQVALATSRGDNDGFGILNPRLALCGLRTITGTSNPFRASSTVTLSFSTWGDSQVAWESNRSLNSGWSNSSLPSSPTAAWRWARARRPCFLAGILSGLLRGAFPRPRLRLRPFLRLERLLHVHPVPAALGVFVGAPKLGAAFSLYVGSLTASEEMGDTRRLWN